MEAKVVTNILLTPFLEFFLVLSFFISFNNICHECTNAVSIFLVVVVVVVVKATNIDNYSESRLMLSLVNVISRIM
jgi:hypothetical protein